MHAAIGRNWSTASAATLTAFPEGDAIVKLVWDDGATLYVEYATETHARERLASLGFSAGDHA